MDDVFVIVLLTFIISCGAAYIIYYPPVSFITGETIKYVFPIILTVNVLLILTLAYMSRKSLKSYLRLDKSEWKYLVVILMVSLFLRVFIVHHLPRMLFDEDIYMQVAASIIESGKTEVCLKYIDGVCLESILDKHPNAMPHTISFFFLLFGKSEALAYTVMALIGSLTVVPIYYLSKNLFDDKTTGYYASFLLALSPLHIIWSGTISTEIHYMFMSLVALNFVLFYVKDLNPQILFMAGLTLAYAIQTRPEAPLIIIVAYLLLLPKLYKTKKRMQMIEDICIFTIILIFFSITHLTHLRYSGATHNWGAPDERFSTKFASMNLQTNAFYWLDPLKTPVLLIPLFLIGLVGKIRRSSYTTLVLLFWIICFFSIFVFFYAGAYTAGGTSSRFGLMHLAPLVVLSGSGASYILGKFRKRSSLVKKIMVVAIILSFVPTISELRYVDFQADEARIARLVAVQYRDVIPDQCVVFTNVPAIVMMDNQNTMESSRGTNVNLVEKLYSKYGCAYFIRDYWCQYTSKEICNTYGKNYQLRNIGYLNTKTNWQFGVYELTPKG